MMIPLAQTPPRRQEIEARHRFDLLADQFKTDVSPDDFRLQAIRRHLRLGSSPVRLLDLGCGKGRFARRLASEGHEVIGLDPSRGMLQAAASSHVDSVQASADRLPFPTSTFDHAIAVEMLEHVHPHVWQRVFLELHRVVRPGGRIVLVDKNALSLDPVRPWLPALMVKWIDQQRGLWMYPAGSVGRERWFWPGQVSRLMRQTGFVAIRSEMLPREDELRQPVFRMLPCFARMVVWTGQVPCGAAT